VIFRWPGEAKVQTLAYQVTPPIPTESEEREIERERGGGSILLSPKMMPRQSDGEMPKECLQTGANCQEQAPAWLHVPDWPNKYR
jgi:hypothetical protein